MADDRRHLPGLWCACIRDAGAVPRGLAIDLPVLRGCVAVTFDVLVQTSRDALEHKMDGAVPVGHLPFWRVTGTPRRTEPGRAILFSDGDRVIARGVIAKLEEGRIWFSPLEEVDEDLPDDAPSRGFTYVDPVDPMEGSA